MSAIGGVLAFGGAPVDPAHLARLGARMGHLGCDSERRWSDDSIGMAYRAFHTTAESRREVQPCRRHQLVACWDGRLDNRDELKARLGDIHADDTDVAIVLGALLRWGSAGLARLVGDFALAVWDRRGRALHLARDCAGTRPLYFHVNGERAIWASDLGALLESPGVPGEIDDDYVASFVMHGHLTGASPFAGIHSVKPAHVVRIDGDGLVSERRFWSIDEDREIRYATASDYEDHFRAAFETSVRARLRSDRPICAHLSGGLDSSAIVCVGDQVLNDTGRTTSDLRTVSYVFDDAPSADERTWIRVVEAHRGAEGWHVSDREAPFWLPHPEPSAIATPSRVLVASGFDSGVRRRMDAIGSRVLLSGHGGDHLLCSAPGVPPHLPKLLRRGRLRQVHRELYAWAAAMRQPYVSLFWRHVLFPRSGSYHDEMPPWLAPAFADRARALRPAHDPTMFSVAVRQMEMEARHEQGGIEFTYPYLDRPLVEFLCAIPYGQRNQPGEPRWLMRRALRGILPDAVRLRRCKGNPTAFIARGLSRARSDLASLAADARVVDRGYVQDRGFIDAIERATEGGERHTAALSLMLRVELWLRLLEGRCAGVEERQPARAAHTAGCA